MRCASDDLSTSGALCLQNLFSSDASSFLLVDSIALSCSSRTLCFKETLNFCIWSCILVQILAYPIDNFLYLVIIKTQRVMLKTFFSNTSNHHDLDIRPPLAKKTPFMWSPLLPLHYPVIYFPDLRCWNFWTITFTLVLRSPQTSIWKINPTIFFPMRFAT